MKTKMTHLPFKKSLVTFAILLASTTVVQAEEKLVTEDIEVITVKGRAAQFYFVE
jgi:hypothetical protein